MTATVRDAPDAGTLVVDALQSFRIGQGIPVVLDLLPRVDVLTWHARALAKTPIVEAQRGTSDVIEKA